VTRSPAAIVLIAGLALAGCTQVRRTPPVPPLQVPEDTIRGRIDTVCIDRLRMDFPVPDAERKAAEIQDLIAGILDRAAIKTVGPAESTRVFNEAVERSGGYYDVHSGERDEVRFAAMSQAGFRALHERLGCDALLAPTVAVVLAPWRNNEAAWDGITDSLGGGGAGGYGYAPALSLWISIQDLDGREIYFGTGGIQIGTQLEQGFLRNRFKGVGDEMLLGRPFRNQIAVETSLAPFLAALRGERALWPDGDNDPDAESEAAQQ
jgi:hypothetical protein